ncbi:nitrate- and nitrite sensing domain-containing protein [Frankia sp. AgB32]|uniref:nitrate- and nitrite sensing domain-containing protein n=1 Tax=Frankia sp. AgB32 TaxID=631119 RepID=UPI00200F63D3|nr:nitrate- and nitrite sensing domain-containing protein [Frankia sp. AgB32]MCK9895835.1 nitrate- and nitrite sensing domain-containing protein [Frankia sp. AgB32]
MLQNWPIRSKLVVILVVPLAALAVLSVIQVRGNVDNVRAANRIKSLASFSIKANDLVAALQTERFATNSYVGSSYLATPQGQLAVDARVPVDQALATYRAGESGLPSSARDPLATTLAAISTRLDKLPAQRRAIDAREARVDQNNTYYNDLVDDLLSLNGRVALGSHSAALVNGAATLASISQAKEEAAQQRGAVARVIILGQQDQLTLHQIESSAGAEDAWLTQFRTTATADEQAYYNATVGRTLSAATAIRDTTVNAVVSGQPVTTTQQAWLQAVGVKIDALHEVELRIANDLGTTSSDISSSATRNALLGGIGVTLVLFLSIAISLLVASPMIRHLRTLRQGALEVATDRLPGVVERLHRGEQVEMTAEIFPVDVKSTDEIGQLAEAFSTVHAVAVRTAVEQAAMRKSIGDTFLNLARRSQALIHRQLKIIDGLERKETDPDELEELFRLDHLATRMRRHAEDLIVLSGSKPARGWRRPVEIKDVVRGAVAEVEDYTRVKVMPIDGGAISGHAVGDVIHMLAELIENATSFSPPHTPVQVNGHEVSNGFVIEVEDRGLGMSAQEFQSINERLSDPPPFDLSTSERLGLFVVGRLAVRHAVSVKLRPSPYGGTMAIVLVPTGLLRQSDEDGDGRPTSGGATVRSLPAPAVPALDGPPFDEDGLAERGPNEPRPAAPRPGDPRQDESRSGQSRSGQPHSDESRPNALRPTERRRAGRGERRLDLAPPMDADEHPADGVRPASVPLADVPRAEEPVPAEQIPVDPLADGPLTAPQPTYMPESITGADETLLDDLPVFATVRSNWFVADRPSHPGAGGRRSDGPTRVPGEAAESERAVDGEPGSVDRDPSTGGDQRRSRMIGRDAAALGAGELDRGPRGGDLPQLPSRRARPGNGYPAGFADPAAADDGRAPVEPAAVPAGPAVRPGQGANFPDPGRYDPAGYGSPARDGALGAGPPASRFGNPGPGDQPARSARPGEVGRHDPLTSPLSRTTGPRQPDPRRGGPAGPGATGPGDEVVPLHRRAGRGRDGGDAAEDGQRGEEQTDLGLPKRTRRASLAPQLRRDAASERPAPLAAHRSPEEIRTMMSSFQSNFGRGLADGQDSNDGDDVGKVT